MAWDPTTQSSWRGPPSSCSLCYSGLYVMTVRRATHQLFERVLSKFGESESLSISSLSCFCLFEVLYVRHDALQSAAVLMLFLSLSGFVAVFGNSLDCFLRLRRITRHRDFQRAFLLTLCFMHTFLTLLFLSTAPAWKTTMQDKLLH